MNSYTRFRYLLILSLGLMGEVSAQMKVMRHTGVYQGQGLFLQNKYDPKSDSFCIQSVRINHVPVKQNFRVSAVNLSFEGMTLQSPVIIEVVHRSGCTPIILNPDAIAYYHSFSFKELVVVDSVVTWKTIGEQPGAGFLVEKYQLGIWMETDTLEAQGDFGKSSYTYFPDIDEGANKFRLKYFQPDGKYLYSEEIDFHYYPEPVTFTPFAAEKELTLSRYASFEVYDAGGDLVLTGDGSVVDITSLPRGDYVIYFNREDPGAFTKK